MKTTETPDRDNLPADETQTPDLTVAVQPAKQVGDTASGSKETDDGLDETDEAVRRAAEDLPSGADPVGPIDNVPVFDRASLPPKA